MVQHSVYCGCDPCSYKKDTRSPRTKARQANYLNGLAPPKRGMPVPTGPLTQSIGDLVKGLNIKILEEPTEAPEAPSEPAATPAPLVYSPGEMFTQWVNR